MGYGGRGDMMVGSKVEVFDIMKVASYANRNKVQKDGTSCPGHGGEKLIAHVFPLSLLRRQEIRSCRGVRLEIRSHHE